MEEGRNCPLNFFCTVKSLGKIAVETQTSISSNLWPTIVFVLRSIGNARKISLHVDFLCEDSFDNLAIILFKLYPLFVYHDHVFLEFV